MKLAIIALLLASAPARAEITSIYSSTVLIEFNGTEATEMLRAVKASGFQPDQYGAINIGKLEDNGLTNDQGDEGYTHDMTLTYGPGSPQQGKLFRVKQNAAAKAIYDAFVAIGAYVHISGKGHNFGLHASDIYCRTADGAPACFATIEYETRIK